MKRWKLGFGLAAVGVAGIAQAQTWRFDKIDPKSTYLRDSQAAPGALRIQLGPSDSEGRFISLRTVGWFNRAIDNPLAHNVSNQAVAVFSASGILDPDWTKQTRIGSATDAGDDFFTLPTFVGSLPTDISQDFGVGPSILQIEIPNGANFLHFTPYDNGFWNNGDDFSMPGADPRGFGVEWRVQTLPEPGTWAVLAVGGAALIRRRRRRAQ